MPEMTSRDHLGGGTLECVCEIDALSPYPNGLLRLTKMSKGIAGQGQGSNQAAGIPEDLGQLFHLVHHLEAPVQLSDHQK
jgi:hypothetical protein